MPANNSSIIVCGQRYDVGQRVITFEDDPSISAYTLHCVTHPGIFPTQPAKGLGTIAARFRERRLIGADKSLARLQQVLRQFVIHHDGMGTSRDCFRVLHDERGLSVHFLIDNNGDIYQTLDLVDCGFQAAGVNEISVGVELCNRGDALLYPDFYKREKEFLRDVNTCTINNHQWLAFGYTKPQFESMVSIAKALARLFPGLPQVCPQGGDGEPLWATLAGDPREFSGYLGHYHVTNQKWDPGPWDFKKFVQNIRGRTFYPALPGRATGEIPDDADEAKKAAGELYDNNEKGGGGYFPVGPMGQTRLWHSGVHMADERGKPVFAPFGGKLVAARLKGADDWPQVGSNNFVLLKHELPVSGQKIGFFTLLLHLDAESDPTGTGAPQWLRGGKDKKWMPSLKAGEIALLDENIGAGELVAHFGEAGKKGEHTGQIHFEILAVDEVSKEIDPTFWATVEGGKGRFCTERSIIGQIDRAPPDGMLSHGEVQAFFENNPVRETFRRVAVHHVSEWGDNGDFEAALQASPDYRAFPAQRRHQVYEDQIASMFWWTDEVAAHAGLPADKIIWSYHPITFVDWIHDKLKGTAQKAKAIQDASAFKGEKPPDTIKDDASEGAEGFMDDEDALFGEKAKELDLEKLAAGYPD